MLTADSADKIATFKVAFLTVASIFVMGYLNALALNTYDLGAMITPQTGNVIWLGINAVSGYWVNFIENLALFLGFVGGVIFALFTLNIFKNKVMQFFYNWTVFIFPIILYPLALRYVVPPFVSFFALGFAAGAALEFFRKLYHLEINNAMATGNARFFGLHFAHGFLENNKPDIKRKERFTFFLFFLCLFAFALGAYLYGMLGRLDYSLSLGYYIGIGSSEYSRLLFGLSEEARYEMAQSNIIRIIGLFVICIIPYFFCPKAKK